MLEEIKIALERAMSNEIDLNESISPEVIDLIAKLHMAIAKDIG